MDKGPWLWGRAEDCSRRASSLLPIRISPSLVPVPSLEVEIGERWNGNLTKQMKRHTLVLVVDSLTSALT
jgi:hypothetical protein